MIGWNFPSNGNGLIRGVAEAGIQTFTGKEISSLAREICQNSLDAAGSFGIGKNAPFANSFYRLVFYRTLNLQGERAAQGMSRLLSFNLESEQISSGVGYYGETDKNLPVKKIIELENICKRNDCGTDIFICGFNGDKFWRENIFTELVENFLVAIHRNKLRVNLQGLAIDKNTLGELLRKYKDKLEKASNYYKILSGNDDVKFFEQDFHGMGKLKLGVLLAPNLNRKVLIARKSGMKLFEQDRISRTISFKGILELEGRKLNEFFREMETPSHDKWEPGRYEKNPKLAKKYLAELKSWIRETISGIGAENVEDEINVEGLNHMLDRGNSRQSREARKFSTSTGSR